MPMAAIAPVMTGVSAIAGAFGHKQQSQTTPTYTPQQEQIQGAVANLLQGRLDNPENYVGTMKNAAMGSVNQNYAGLEERMKRTLTGKGFGKSGKLGLNTQALEIARAGDMGDLESKFAGLQMNYDQSLLDAGTRFGFAGGGQRTTSTNGGGIGGAIGAGAETATTLFALNHFLGGGDDGSGGGGLDLSLDHGIATSGSN